MVAGPYPHEKFAKRLREALTDQGREERGRGAYLARICGLSKESGRKWLEGTALPTMEHAIELAEKLGVCVEWLLTGRGPKKIPSPTSVRVVEAMESLPADSQVTLQKVVDSFVKSAPWDGELERRKTR